MSKVEPFIPVASIRLWGAPYHGLVKNSEINLPNAETREYVQPSDGNTYLIKFPGVEAPERTSSQTERDSLLGREWRNYAIVAGQAAQLHGQDIDSPWLHKDSLGRVWKITAAASVASGSIQMDAERLFYVSRDPTETNLKLSFLVPVASSGVGDSSLVTLMDIRPDGGEAAFRLDDGSDTALIRISLSGLGDHAFGATGSMALNLVKNVDDSYIVDDVVDYNTITQYVASANTETGTWTDGHGCDMPTTVSTVSNTPTYEGDHILNNSITDNREIIDRTWYFWGFYDKDGGFEHVAVRKYHSKNNKTHYNTTGGGSIAGQATSNYPVSLSCSTHSSNIAYWTNTGSESYTTDIDQAHEGIVRMEVLVNDVAVSVCELIHSEQIPGEDPPGFRTYTRAATSPAADPGAGDMILDSVVPRPVFKITLDGDILASGDSVLFTDYPFETSAGFKDLNFIPDLNHGVLPTISALQITNKMLALKIANAVTPDYTYKDHVTPFGVDGISLTTSAQDEYGTVQPETGEITRNQSVPVAYV